MDVWQEGACLVNVLKINVLTYYYNVITLESHVLVSGIMLWLILEEPNYLYWFFSFKIIDTVDLRIPLEFWYFCYQLHAFE